MAYWPSRWPCTPWGSTRASTRSSERNTEIRCCACRRGEAYTHISKYNLQPHRCIKSSELASEHPLCFYERVRRRFCADHFRDLQVFEELFSFACPKFLSPVVPNYDNVHPNYHKEPFQQQLKVFAEEVQQQAQLSTIRRCVFASSLLQMFHPLSMHVIFWKGATYSRAVSLCVLKKT